MRKTYSALSIVAPNGKRIANKLKTIEVRKWIPDQLPLRDLVIVENQNYLLNEGDEDEGAAVVLVDIESVHEWQPHEFNEACANYWEEGYWAWVISNVRPIHTPQKNNRQT